MIISIVGCVVLIGAILYFTVIRHRLASQADELDEDVETPAAERTTD